jgi:hypothetical protein
VRSLNRFGLDVWQATKWDTEPRSTPEDGRHRYTIFAARITRRFLLASQTENGPALKKVRDFDLKRKVGYTGRT